MTGIFKIVQSYTVGTSLIGVSLPAWDLHIWRNSGNSAKVLGIAGGLMQNSNFISLHIFNLAVYNSNNPRRKTKNNGSHCLALTEYGCIFLFSGVTQIVVNLR